MPFRHARTGWSFQLFIIEQAGGIYTDQFPVSKVVAGFKFSAAFGFGRTMLIAAASRLVLMCAA